MNESAIRTAEQLKRKLAQEQAKARRAQQAIINDILATGNASSDQLEKLKELVKNKGGK